MTAPRDSRGRFASGERGACSDTRAMRVQIRQWKASLAALLTEHNGLAYSMVDEWTEDDLRDAIAVARKASRARRRLGEKEHPARTALRRAQNATSKWWEEKAGRAEPSAPPHGNHEHKQD